MSDATLGNLIAHSAQVLIVVSMGAMAASIVRLPMARARVIFWRLIIVACLALPLLAQPDTVVIFAPPPSPSPATSGSIGNLPDGLQDTGTSAAALVSVVLIAGAAARIAWLGLGMLALGRLRRRSDGIDLDDDLDTLRKAVAPGAAIRWNREITQPVAFGWRRPIVLLPDRVASLPADARRAVVCHELLHVARRDWIWMLGEEAVGCLFWFHPAIWFALGRLQLSREELVDEEVVRITGVRQPYVRALAMFAGEPAAFAAATPFIRRRHLVSRIKKLSKEHTMSRLRIAVGFVALMVVVAGSGWVAAFAAPLRAGALTVLPLPTPGAPTTVSLRQIVPGPLSPADLPAGNQGTTVAQGDERAEEVAEKLKRLAAVQLQAAADAQRRATPEPRVVHLAGQGASPVDTATYRVAPVYPEAARGHGVEAVVTVRVTVGTAGEVTNVETIRTRLTTERDITDPTFWASQPSRLFGQAAEDAVRQWRFEPTGAIRRFEVPVSFAEQHQMVFVPAARAPVSVVNTVVAGTASSPETKPTRIRVGGVIRQPSMVLKVEPVYPLVAKQANIQGVVILEIVVGTDGSVQEARVFRSIPLLDQAALDAVVQWKYQPTLLNGVPVEAISTVTVNFTLQ